MTGHRIIAVTFVALLALGCSGATALAGGGGASPDVLTLPGAAEPIAVRIGNPLVRASGHGIDLAVRSTALLRGRVRIAGTAPAATGTVAIERRDELAGWIPVAGAAVAADGSFAVIWRPDRVGSVELRAVPGAAAAGNPTATTGAPRLDVTVYRPGIASWYGPTSHEATTACGVPLMPTTLGVAHRTLPCGTPVALYYKGRTVVVPVIDRGPFVAGRTWDLTRAAHAALGGDDGLIRVGALPAPQPPTATPARGR